jgi:hypothetical protein
MWTKIKKRVEKFKIYLKVVSLHGLNIILGCAFTPICWEEEKWAKQKSTHEKTFFCIFLREFFEEKTHIKFYHHEVGGNLEYFPRVVQKPVGHKAQQSSRIIVERRHKTSQDHLMFLSSALKWSVPWKLGGKSIHVKFLGMLANLLEHRVYYGENASSQECRLFKHLGW